MTIHCDVIDQSSAGGRYDWAKIVHAIQTQVRMDVAQAWGIGNSSMIQMRDAPAPGHWPVYILDNSDVSGALGYHETDPDDPTKPVGKVFVLDDEKYGLSPSVTLSHEIVEILGDPWALHTEQCNPSAAAEFWATELCDPVEADADGYELEGVLLSDFVLPAYFFSPATAKGPFDYCKRLAKPRTLRPGGYQAYWNGRTWTQRTAQAAPGVTSRALTMGRNKQRRALIEWVEALAADGGPNLPAEPATEGSN